MKKNKSSPVPEASILVRSADAYPPKPAQLAAANTTGELSNRNLIKELIKIRNQKS